MKKVVKMLISTVLCIAMLLSFASCNYINGIINPQSNTNSGNTNTTNNNKNDDRIVPKGYTGGLEYDLCFHEEYGIYWLETYDEVLVAVDLLKSHGSTIKRSIAFDCEGDLLDVKFSFVYKRSKAEKLEDGKDFFDRKIDDGEFSWYAFLEDISIDDFKYYKIVYYMDVWYFPSNSINYSRVATIENLDDMYLDWTGKGYPGFENTVESSYDLCYEGKCFAVIKCPKTLIPTEYHEEFLNTFVIIE